MKQRFASDESYLFYPPRFISLRRCKSGWVQAEVW